MGFFERFKDWLEGCIRVAVVFITNWLPVKVIRDEHGVPFLYRYYVISFGKDGPGICFHRFVASDPDRGYHDHPWSHALSFVLCGGYQERIVNRALALVGEPTFNTVTRGRWCFNHLDGAKTFHRVMIDDGKDAWSLFAFTGRSKLWGMIGLDGEYNAMSKSISDADGGWWNHVGNGYSIYNHIDHPGKVIATVDIVVLRETDNERRNEILNNEYQVLLIKRGKEPFKDCWAFPGGRIEARDRDIETAARRELLEETSIDVEEGDLKYYQTIGNAQRDPRGFCVTNVFVYRVDGNVDIRARAGDDAVDAKWFNVYALPKLAFDHRSILLGIMANKND